MKKKRQIDPVVQIFILLAVVIGLLVGGILLYFWKDGLIPVKQTFVSHTPGYAVTTVDWETSGYFAEGEGLILHTWRKNGRSSMGVPWKEIKQLTWSPDGMSFFMAVRTIEGSLEHRVVQQLAGDNPDGVGSWGSREFIPKLDEPDLICNLTLTCKDYSGFPPGWTEIRLEFCSWGSDSETLIYHYTLDTWGEGFLEYHFPTDSITRVYNWE